MSPCGTFTECHLAPAVREIALPEPIDDPGADALMDSVHERLPGGMSHEGAVYDCGEAIGQRDILRRWGGAAAGVGHP